MIRVQDGVATPVSRPSENLPNTLFEAMAAGLPIAASGHPPMPQALGAGGQYFNPENPDELVSVLGRLASEWRMRAEIASAAHERAQRFSWSECASSTFRFLAYVASCNNA
jgi:glycosyltransferase involved in cell wall biosynthesis